MKIKLLEDEVNQLKTKNASLTLSLEEEANECETLNSKLKDTLESLDCLQSKFIKLELKHIKTCSEFCLKRMVRTVLEREHEH